MRMFLVIPFASLFLAGCGGGSDAPDLSGTYRIDLHTESKVNGGTPATCNSEGPAVTGGKGFLKLTVDTSFGRELNWALCGSATDPASCSERFIGFRDAGGDWEVGAATSAALSGTLCTLFHAEGAVTVPAEGQVKVVFKEWGENPFSPPASCELSDADKLASKADCDEHTVITATKLP